MRARVFVTLKREVLDPQGEAVKRGLASLGMTNVSDVRVGKLIEIEIDADRDAAADEIQEAARRLLSNPVIEDFRIELVDPA
jgi:phosphoribosylformylglycinamidine synthase PurS subunit